MQSILREAPRSNRGWAPISVFINLSFFILEAILSGDESAESIFLVCRLEIEAKVQRLLTANCRLVCI